MLEDKSVVVFDLDGTLVDMALDWKVIGKKLLDSFPGTGIRSPEEKTVVITESIAKKLGEEGKKAAYRMIRKFEKGCNMTSIDKNITLAMELKERGKKLAIFSSNCRESIEECLRKAGMRDIFDFIVGKEDLEKHKPNPEGLFKIMRHFGAPRDKVVFVGNDEDDAAAAKSAGVDFLLV